MMRGPQTARASSPSGTGYYGDARCRSIWQWQLVIAFTIVAIALGVAMLTPERFGNWRFTAGMIFIIALTLAALAIPWHRIGASGVLVLPLLDIFAIDLIAAGDTPAASFLWVFPLTWIASFYSVSAMIAAPILIGALRILNLLVLGVTAEATINVMILLITLGFVAVITAVGARRNRSARRLLSAQSDRLAHSVLRINDQRARNARLLDTLSIGLARLTTTGLVEIANDAFRTIYALDVTKQFHPNHAVEYRERRGQAVPANQTALMRAARGELFENEIVWLFGLDGQWRAVKTSTKIIGSGQYANDGLLLVVEDVTESVDQHARDDAKRRSISHELRNPLTAILGHIDLVLERDDLAESARRQLEVVERAGDRMQQLIDQALVAPGARNDDADVDFDLTDLTRASVEAFAPTADESGVTIEPLLEEALPLCGDAFRVRQVVDNVLGNAIKYAQHNGKVVIQTYRPNQHEVALRIIDNGIGIAEEDIPRIFERDFRTEAARASGIPGTGLGLSISRDIIEAQGGRLEVTSELGQGTEFTVFLSAPIDIFSERTPE